MSRPSDLRSFVFEEGLTAKSLSHKVIREAVDFVHHLVDGIDEKLLAAGSDRLAELVELANLSAIIGNLFRGGIVTASKGAFAANAPHKYPDLLGKGAECPNIEIKVALETNKPKGHLVKPGPHITLRYVLAGEGGKYVRGKANRGNVPWIWEVRIGDLKERHFNFSNTEGDSGKTAVINAEGMAVLTVVYVDLERCPLSPRGSEYRRLATLLNVPHRS